MNMDKKRNTAYSESPIEQFERNKDGRLITVIVPVYNTREYLDACLESIVNQEYTNIEILIINDGSTDDSLTKCAEWETKDHRISCETQEHRGLSAARNKGVALSRGEYITFIDSDDVVEGNYISYLYETLQVNDADIAVAYLHRTDNKASSVPSNVPEVCCMNEAMDLLCAGDIPVNATCKLYKRELLQQTPFVEGMVYEDNLFAFEVIGRCNKLANCRRILYHHIIRPGSITQTWSINNCLDQIKAYNSVADYIGHFYSFSDKRYISILIDAWFDLEYLFHKYHYGRIMNKQECIYVKDELHRIRNEAMKCVSMSNMRFNGKKGMKLFVMRYIPKLCYPLNEAYQRILRRT